MLKADVIDLITEHRSGHGVHEAVTETARTVYCTVQSVTRSVFRLSLAEDYQGERAVRYRGQRFRVIRTYVTEDDGIEITVERADENGQD